MNYTFRNALFLLFTLFNTTNLFSLPTDSLDFSYKSINSKSIKISSVVNKNKATVFIFYSPVCPICQSQTKTIKELFEQYRSDSIAFVMVFPGSYYSKKEIKHFLKEYGITIPSLIDKDFKLTKTLAATVTPEVVVLNRNYNKIYSGLIDNYFMDIGKRRTIITEHYLQDVIDATLQNKKPKTERTEPVGCILNIKH